MSSNDKPAPLRSHMPVGFSHGRSAATSDDVAADGPSYPSMAVDCPDCEQPAGQPCVTMSENPKPKDKPHKARVDAFEALGEGTE